jgi:hypothetical protein
LRYRQTVSGFDFDLIDSSIPRLKGVNFSKLPDDAYIVNSPKAEEYVSNLIELFAQQSNVIDQLDKFFSGSKLYVWQQHYDLDRRAPADIFSEKSAITCPSVSLQLVRSEKSGSKGAKRYFIDCPAVFKDSGSVIGYDNSSNGNMPVLRFTLTVEDEYSGKAGVILRVSGFSDNLFAFKWTGSQFEDEIPSGVFTRITKLPAGGVPDVSQSNSLAKIDFGIPGESRYELRDDTWSVFTLPKNKCWTINPDNFPNGFSVFHRADYGAGKLYLRSSKGVTSTLIDVLQNGETGRWGYECKF